MVSALCVLSTITILRNDSVLVIESPRNVRRRCEVKNYLFSVTHPFREVPNLSRSELNTHS